MAAKKIRPRAECDPRPVGASHKKGHGTKTPATIQIVFGTRRFQDWTSSRIVVFSIDIASTPLG
jgi:hypothetical protein